MDFNSQPTTKKGYIGEIIINNLLIQKGWCLYKTENQRHPVDYIVMNDKDVFMVEIKTKARRNEYPDTGFNYSQYKEYMRKIKKLKMPLYVFFVDEILKQIYYGDILEMSIFKEYDGYFYPKVVKCKNNTEIIFFYQPAMIKLCDLSDDQVNKINEFSTRNYEPSLQQFLITQNNTIIS